MTDEMPLYAALIILGGLFAIGLIANEVGRRTRLPRVTLLILFGLLAGPVGFDVLPESVKDWYEFLASTALTMIAFLLGGALSLDDLQKHGRHIVVISIAIVVVTVVTVGGGLLLLGVAPILALLLAGIATATDPAATQDVIKQSQSGGGEFAETLRGIVAIDDAWGLIAFSLTLIVANMLAGNGIADPLRHGAWELAGAIAVGTAVGFPAALLTGRLQAGEPIQTEVLAVVFLCAGLAIWLKVSFILAGIVAGTIVVNFAKHHTRPFHEIENIEGPFLILFFFLAGASLQTQRWWEFIAILAGYVCLRTAARILGGWIGAAASGAPASYRRWMGVALLPQAGVAVGMALVAGDRFPELRDTILSVTIATTIAFELFGPLATGIALDKTAQKAAQEPRGKE